MANSQRTGFKEKLTSRAPTVGIRADFASADLVEFLGGLGYDYLFLDCETGGADFHAVVEMTRAARCVGLPVLLRPWSAEQGLVRRYLDCGADGIMAPDIDSADQAQALYDVIAAAIPQKLASFVFCPVIESKAGVEDAERILALPCVDAVVLGPSDLAVSVGEPRKGDAPKTAELVFQVLGRARQMGKSACLPATRYGTRVSVDKGANMLIFGAKDALQLGARRQFESVPGAAAAA